MGRWRICWAVATLAGCCVLAFPAPAQEGGGTSPLTAQEAETYVVLGQQTKKLFGEGKYAEALPLAEKMLVIAEKTFGPEDPTVSIVLTGVALPLKELGRYAEAEPLYKRAMAITEKALGVDHPKLRTALDGLAAIYEAQGRYSEAKPLLERSLAIAEKQGDPDHPDVGGALNSLAALYKALERHAEAEPLYKRALAIAEKAWGPDHHGVGASSHNLAVLYQELGRYAEAEAMAKRALAIAEKTVGRDHGDFSFALLELATLYHAQGRYAEAAPLIERGLAIAEKALGPDHRTIGTFLSAMARLHHEQGHFVEAETLFKRILAIDEKALGAEHPIVATTLSNLASLHLSQGRYGEAEALFKRTLLMRERLLGPEHVDVGLSLHNLAALYQAEIRYAEAEPLYKRSLAIAEATMGRDHPKVGKFLANLAALHNAQDRHAEAEPLYKRSLAIAEKALGLDHPDVGRALQGLAGLYRSERRYSEAEPLYRRSLEIRERAFGPDHPDVGSVLSGLADLYAAQGRYAEAETLYMRGLAISEKISGPDHPDVGAHLNSLAFLAMGQGDLLRATDYLRRSVEVWKHREERGLKGSANSLPENESIVLRAQSAMLVKATYQLAAGAQTRRAAFARETFEAAQRVYASEAAQALANMAVRLAKGAGDLAALVREHQELAVERREVDRLLFEAKSEPLAKRKPGVEKALSDRLAKIDERLAAITARFAKDFPDYAALANPKPVSASDVQAQLGSNEALVVFFVTPEFERLLEEETFIWVITRGEIRWVRSHLGPTALLQRVGALRCGLDRAGNWGWEPNERRWLARRPACEALQPEGLGDDEPLPFEPAIAYELYKGLFGGVEDLITGKHLLVVPSGALTSLPFQVLVTKPPLPGQDYQSLAWLARDHALTVLPSAASLTALRRNARTASGPEPFIGFGDPVLAGRCGPVLVPKTCPDEDIRLAKAQAPAPRFARGLGAASEYYRDGVADVAALRKACPLPDTAHELKCVAKSLGAPPSSLVLGKAMTEAAAKSMPLDHYRIIHFATHGLLAGETARFAQNRAEPALLFTPPEKATEEDDGLLTASEITRLKLDADWVIMSACNTAGGDKPGAEALSGLAKAFFYAGARALLVSHWPVDSYAATMLTSRTFAELRRYKSIGRAEAFRRAMLALINDKQRPWATHPSVWAPFVVVGEGGAASK